MKIELTRDEIVAFLAQHILVQECRDAPFRDAILDKHANEPYYEALTEIYDELSLAYFKLGADVAYLLKD